MSTPTRLRAEHLKDAFGIAETKPRLSWWLPPGATYQIAYQLEVDGVPLERVESDRSVLVPWPCDALTSRQIATWRVKLWTDEGESGWSIIHAIEVGLLDASDWSALWIRPDEVEVGASGERPVHFLAQTFSLGPAEMAATGAARMYATAHGIYEVFFNGERVGDIELAPGFTAYDKNLHVQTYAVGDLLVAGENRCEVRLSDGWFRGRTGFVQQTNSYGSRLAFLGQIEIGSLTFGTGPEWSCATGPILAADLMAGQREDRRVPVGPFRPVRTASIGMDHLGASPAPSTRRVEEIQPRSVTRLDDDRQIVDLGQNINGWVRLSSLGPAGTRTMLVHGEALDRAGDVTLEHLEAFDWDTREPIPLGQTDHVISAGTPGDVFEPRHTTKGFQYVRVEGRSDDLTTGDITGIVVHTDLVRTGRFRCSDERINRFWEITDWSFRDNVCEVPTDCPTRERAGWTGDYQLFISAATFLYDVAGFSRKWLRDLIADAQPNGCINNFAPDPSRPNAVRFDVEQWKMMQGSSGWGDAITIVPWHLHRTYGDEDVLAECWPAMTAWVDFAARRAEQLRHPSRVERGPAQPHEQFIWDGGWHWGEWHEPGEEFVDEEERNGKDKGDVGTAYLHHSASLVARIGRILGRDVEAERYGELANAVLGAWRSEFIRADGSLTHDTQANHVRALAFGLVPEELRAQTADRLVVLIREADTHLGTGFLATPLLLPVLADTGHLDLAYELLHQDTVPSWLAMVDAGATTVWESWGGLLKDPTASLNHFSKGAVVSFLHEYVAGLRQVDGHAGYRRFRVEPRPGGGLTAASAQLDSVLGRIEASWRIESGRFDLTVTVPPGSRADVVLPDGTSRETAPGTSTFDCFSP